MNTGDTDRLFHELIAYLEGELAPEEHARVEQQLETSEEYRTEYEWLRSLYADLDALGARAAKHAPEIDVVDSVLKAVERMNTPTPLAAPRRGPGSIVWLGLAAAAALAIVIGAIVLRAPQPDDTPGGAGTTPIVSRPKDSTPSVPTPKLPGELASSKEKLDQKRLEMQRRLASKDMEQTAGPRIELPGSISDVVAARRDAAGGASMDKLMQWASLSKSKALEIALAPDATPQVMLGAAEALEGEEARRILLTAVGKLQDDPGSRLQLARAFAEDPAAQGAEREQLETQAVTQLNDVKNVDPGNALPYYFEAKLELEDGNVVSALQLINSAANLGKVSAYSLESALAQAEALTAAGMDPAAAELVSALTAGVKENKFLCQLAQDLLEYGQGFLSANDLQTAERIFRGVQQLGRQVEEGAIFSQEQLAGMDIQAQALDALGPLYSTIESAEGVAAVTAEMEALTVRITELDQFFQVLDTLFQTTMNEEFWASVSSLILDSGDLSLFSYPEIAAALSASAS